MYFALHQLLLSAQLRHSKRDFQDSFFPCTMVVTGGINDCLACVGYDMFGLGLPEAIILGIIVLVLFGRRLPNLFRSLGASLPAFKQGLAEEESQPVSNRKALKAPDHSL